MNARYTAFFVTARPLMNKGFTLIEIIITLAIIGVIVVFTYPSYQDGLTRARRTEGQSALLDLASRMEAYYAENNTYHTATIATGSTRDHHYTLAIIQATENTYILQATPVGSQAVNDKRCQSLTYNHLGEKNISAGPTGSPTGTTEQCW